VVIGKLRKVQFLRTKKKKKKKEKNRKTFYNTTPLYMAVKCFLPSNPSVVKLKRFYK
jgi:hypothetical protein